MAKHSLLQIATPLWSFIIELRKEIPSEKNYQALHYYLITELNTIAHQAQEIDCSTSEIDNFKYAIAATIDELLMDSTWDHQQQWASQTLQLSLFGEHMAGEQFFSRLAVLREDPKRNRCLIRVFYVCLQLGFRGIYRTKKPGELETLIDQLSTIFSESDGDHDTSLFIQTPQQVSEGRVYDYGPLIKKCLMASLLISASAWACYQHVIKQDCYANIELYERF